jgi:CubicO group peptidase (beta-lactamase class C family)
VTSLDELLTAARRDVDSGLVPACQLAVARDDDIVVFETFGEATDDTRFAIFSATKPIVASAMWLLIGDGSLDVHRRVVEYIPEFATFGKEVVTVEQVMLHTSGFPSPRLLADGADPSLRLQHFRDWRLEWEPGTQFQYHGVSAHWVLAELIERLSGGDFRDFVEQRVTRPLGLPRVLGLPDERHGECAGLVAVGDDDLDGVQLALDAPAARRAGIPGGGAFMTAAELARFYQGLLHDAGGVWDAEVLDDAKTNVRCNFDDPMLGVPVQRTLGLVLAGDDGKHQLRYAIFGADCSPGSFGHAGANAQVAWADPASGISFVYLQNAVDSDVMRGAMRSNRLATIASGLDL